MLSYQFKNSRGFTLFELLIVIGIIAILSVMILLALDPLTRFAQARNARRWSDVNNVSTAVAAYLVDHSQLPAGIDQQERQLGTATSGCSQNCPNAADACLNLSTPLRPNFQEMPFDLKASPERTGYSIMVDEYRIVTVKSCLAEDNTRIRITR